jgi:hypothetical protein
VETGDWRDDEPDPSAEGCSEDADAHTATYCVKDTVWDADKAEGVCGAHAAGGTLFREGEEMRAEYIFPTLLIALDVCAAMPYAWHGNWRMMVYWLAAATLTACVTYTGGKA